MTRPRDCVPARRPAASTTYSAASRPDARPPSEEPALKPVRIILRRELASYFAPPLANVFIVIFLLLAGVCTFSFGALFERGQANLDSFFSFLPWLYILLAPAVAMRLWAEELNSGSIE